MNPVDRDLQIFLLNGSTYLYTNTCKDKSKLNYISLVIKAGVFSSDTT